MLKLTPHLWFDKDAEAAAELYCSIFPNSRIVERRRYENAGPGGNEVVTTVIFEVNGQRVIGLNAGPAFKLNEAFSFFVECDTQAEVDEYWAKLTADGGEEGPCGWLKDRFGVSWQIAPKDFDELLRDKDKDRASRAMKAMMQMKKLDVAALRKAADGEA